MGRSVDTVQRALRDLEHGRWIQVVKLNGPGTVAAYVVNSAIAWGQPRDQLHLAMFSAAVIADAEDQDEATLGHRNLRRIPTLVPGKRQLPAGLSEDPSSQLLLEDVADDAPA